MNLRYPRIAFVAVAFAVTLAGCVTPKRLDVAPVRHEAIAGTIDAQWFERKVFSPVGVLIAIELVYCPNTSAGEEPCRTSVIWRSEKSSLVDTLQPPKPAPSK